MEPFGIQNFLVKNSVEPFILAVFLTAIWIDLDRFDANPFEMLVFVFKFTQPEKNYDEKLKFLMARISGGRATSDEYGQTLL